jgi:hypothetical protein
MMRALTLVHRWLGVAFCLLFAMWFASGIVMHFVPFPSFTEADHFAGLPPISLTGDEQSPVDAVGASGVANATRVRLVARSDGPTYVISHARRVVALRAGDLTGAAVQSPDLALAIARDYAHRRGWDAAAARVTARVAYDQWTMSGAFDSDRPLYRVALNEEGGTELYVSSATGEIVLTTRREQRLWNYVGSVAHWIYPTALRSHPATWSMLVWWLALIALLGAAAGAMLGILRGTVARLRPTPPYRAVQAWHYRLGLGCMIFVMTWIFSGWLSMDDGLLFSTGKPGEPDIAVIAGAPAWQSMPRDELSYVAVSSREVEWFAFGGRLYRRERFALDRQRVSIVGVDSAEAHRAFLRPDEIDSAMHNLVSGCDRAVAVTSADNYAIASAMPGAPVYRVTCGADWFDIDGADGTVLEKLDPSRRVYRWLYSGLHTLNLPVLTAHRAWRTALISVLCGFGLFFSLTGVAMAWRRLRASFRRRTG